MRGITTADFRDSAPLPWNGQPTTEPLPASPLRTGYRYAEQLVSNTLYGAL